MSGSNRKFGRCKNRPSNKRYTGEQRWIKNKKLAVARDQRAKAKAAERKEKRAERARNGRPFSEPRQLRAA